MEIFIQKECMSSRKHVETSFSADFLAQLFYRIEMQMQNLYISATVRIMKYIQLSVYNFLERCSTISDNYMNLPNAGMNKSISILQ